MPVLAACHLNCTSGTSSRNRGRAFCYHGLPLSALGDDELVRDIQTGESKAHADEPNLLPDYEHGLQMRISSDELFIAWANGTHLVPPNSIRGGGCG